MTQSEIEHRKLQNAAAKAAYLDAGLPDVIATEKANLLYPMQYNKVRSIYLNDAGAWVRHDATTGKTGFYTNEAGAHARLIDWFSPADYDAIRNIIANPTEVVQIT